jgi:predicted RNase H-like HicB family nuclease
MRIKVILEPSEEGGYTAIVPSLPGCISEGNSKDEALKNIREAVDLYLEPVEDDQVLAPHSCGHAARLVRRIDVPLESAVRSAQATGVAFKGVLGGPQ